MKQKAFTLVELLGVIVLLGILGVVIIPKVGDSITNSKETAYITQEEQIKKAAYDFIVDNIELFDNTDTVTIKLGVLKQKGYLPVNIKNPKTRKNISNESTITITKTNEKFEITLNLIDLIEVTEDIDNNSPIIVLNGNYVEYVNINSDETEINRNLIQNGAKAYSSSGEVLTTITKQIKIGETEKTSIKTNALETYEITYTVTDNGKTVSATRTVIIRDTEAPLITFQKETTLPANQVNGYDLRAGVSVTDNYENIDPYNEQKLKVNSSLSNVPGKYLVTYTATDSSGNTTTERRVIIVESTPTYIIKGNTVKSSEDTPTMENPVTYYGFGRDNYIDVIETHGKNLFDEESILGSIDGVQYTDGHYVFTTGNAHTKYQNRIPLTKFKEKTQYTITIQGYSYGEDNNGHNGFTNFRLAFKYTDGTESYSALNYKTETTLTYTSDNNKTVEKICINYGWGGRVYISHIQLEEGTQATPYEPYQGSSTTRIDLTGHDPLMCLDDICDYIDYENNRIVRNVGKYTVTGSENWAIRNSDATNGIYSYSITTTAWMLNNINYKYYGNVKAMSNYIEYSSTVGGAAAMYSASKKLTLYYNRTSPNSRCVYINTSDTTLADFKSNLQSLYNNGTPMIIYYELAEPTYESITLPQVNLRWDSDTFVTDGYVTKTYN